MLIENLILRGRLTKYSRYIHTSWNVGEAVGVILRISMWAFFFVFFCKCQTHIRELFVCLNTLMCGGDHYILFYDIYYATCFIFKRIQNYILAGAAMII